MLTKNVRKGRDIIKSSDIDQQPNNHLMNFNNKIYCS